MKIKEGTKVRAKQAQVEGRVVGHFMQYNTVEYYLYHMNGAPQFGRFGFLKEELEILDD